MQRALLLACRVHGHDATAHVAAARTPASSRLVRVPLVRVPLVRRARANDHRHWHARLA